MSARDALGAGSGGGDRVDGESARVRRELLAAADADACHYKGGEQRLRFEPQ